MPFDFVVLGDDGSPEVCVPIGIKLHCELVAAADTLKLKNISKFRDYYMDVKISGEDLDLFCDEISVLHDHKISGRLKRTLEDLIGLVAYAREHGRALDGIAD